jgi:superfamily II DNA or RNA helicase
MYTSVLNWLGVGGRTQRRDCSLLGLTATPFRGMSESETERLAARYGRRRLDIGVLGDDPYQELQRLGVLAKVEHRLLGGSKLELTAAEVLELDRLKKLPKSAEQRLGEDKGRNQTLLDEVTGLPDDWPCLLFCTSVQHAELMAALLTFSGVPARAISGATDANRRRHAIEEFRQGRIRVLTNYGVLTQGFDAPMVQAIIVGRPTYSPNVYQQMIGRGLRGPANGGSDTCLIVNVEDTVDQFGTELAFRQFEHIWSGS